MDETKPRRRWWRRKRTIAAAVLWLSLPVLYVLSVGPALYLRYDGTLPKDVYAAAYGPLWAGYRALGLSGRGPLILYCDWWNNLAYRHGRVPFPREP